MYTNEICRGRFSVVLSAISPTPFPIVPPQRSPYLSARFTIFNLVCCCWSSAILGRSCFIACPQGRLFDSLCQDMSPLHPMHHMHVLQPNHLWHSNSVKQAGGTKGFSGAFSDWFRSVEHLAEVCSNQFCWNLKTLPSDATWILGPHQQWTHTRASSRCWWRCHRAWSQARQEPLHNHGTHWFSAGLPEAIHFDPRIWHDIFTGSSMFCPQAVTRLLDVGSIANWRWAIFKCATCNLGVFQAFKGIMAPPKTLSAIESADKHTGYRLLVGIMGDTSRPRRAGWRIKISTGTDTTSNTHTELGGGTDVIWCKHGPAWRRLDLHWFVGVALNQVFRAWPVSAKMIPNSMQEKMKYSTQEGEQLWELFSISLTCSDETSHARSLWQPVTLPGSLWVVFEALPLLLHYASLRDEHAA